MSKDLRMSYLLDFYGEVLTEKQNSMMQQYFNMDLSLSEVADNFNITRQGVRDAVKRSETVLVELEEKIGFAKKYSGIQSGVEEIRTLVQNINFHNENSYASSDEIKKFSERILSILNEISE